MKRKNISWNRREARYYTVSAALFSVLTLLIMVSTIICLIQISKDSTTPWWAYVFVVIMGTGVTYMGVYTIKDALDEAVENWRKAREDGSTAP